MERLTTKYIEDNVPKYDLAPRNFDGDLSMYNAECEAAIDKVINKLGPYEDEEEKLGIDLITLIKALKNGVYVKRSDYITFQKVGIDENAQLRTFLFSQLYGVEFDYFLDFEDYGKTWALTKEELE